MGILVECPKCKVRGSVKRKVCKCGNQVQKSDSKIYWIDPGIPTLPRPTFKGGTETCVLRGPFCGFSEPSKAMEIPSSKELHRKPNQKTKHRKIKSVNPPPDAIGAVKIFP